ncbi:MAG TPA: YfcE family phosphodiesterase [Mycobacteriales bacterium]|nr:YfcE family phosphodiesterase [Mycobacteriales bacterium]
MRAVVLADTHVPRRARDLPAALWAAIDAADVVIHAGDWVAASLVEEIAARARLVGVFGNNDGPDIRAVLPEVARADLGGVRVAVVHETGASAGRERRMDATYGGTADLLVFGHSHIPWDTTTPGGLRLLNPGSPTDRRRQPAGTWVEATFAGGAAEVAWHRVDPR